MFVLEGLADRGIQRLWEKLPRPQEEGKNSGGRGKKIENKETQTTGEVSSYRKVVGKKGKSKEIQTTVPVSEEDKSLKVA